MNWKISLILATLALSSCMDSQEEVVRHTASAPVSYLIEADEVLPMSNRPGVRIVDFRKNEDYAIEHIAGAVNIWRSDIEDSTYTYGGMMASPTQLETLFRRLGIHTNDTLVIYDDNGLCNAARLWWILQNYDVDRVKLMQGGIEAWKAVGGKVTHDITRIAASEFTLTTTPSMRYYISKEEVQQAIGTDVHILDTRSTDEFSGMKQKKGAYKSGRIPGSVHIDWVEAIHYGGDQRMRPTQELESIYARSGAKKNDAVIVYCHSGVRSAHTTFVLTQLLGYTNVRNYDGSWTEWSHSDDLPIENDFKSVK